MAESKSTYFGACINTHSEKTRIFTLLPVNRLAAVSECPALVMNCTSVFMITKYYSMADLLISWICSSVRLWSDDFRLGGGHMPTTRTEAQRVGLQHARKEGRMNDPSWKNKETARFTLNDDLGHFSDSICFDYGLDQKTRDRLIAHAREDSAFALLNTISLMKSVKTLKVLMVIVCIMLGIILFRIAG
jgi:hypothetical protein